VSQKEQPREIAREVAAQRVGELQRWLDKLREDLDTGSLYEAEADYQVIAVLATTTAEQILRVMRESGELRDPAGVPTRSRPSVASTSTPSSTRARTERASITTRSVRSAWLAPSS
jgi:hypothetical protein